MCVGFLKIAIKTAFALSYPSVLNGRLSVRALPFGVTNLFKYENLLTVVISVRSISVSPES